VSQVLLVREINADAVDQLIAIAMQSITHAARPADTTYCAASFQVSLTGPTGSMPIQAWYWSMQRRASSFTATVFGGSAHGIMFSAPAANITALNRALSGEPLNLVRRMGRTGEIREPAIDASSQNPFVSEAPE